MKKAMMKKAAKNDPVSVADEIFDFPCHFPIKAMGRKTIDFEQCVTQIVLQHAQLHVDGEVRVTPSGAGNFLSVTVDIEAVSREQLNRIYQDLTDCEQVLMAL